MQHSGVALRPIKTELMTLQRLPDEIVNMVLRAFLPRVRFSELLEADSSDMLILGCMMENNYLARFHLCLISPVCVRFRSNTLAVLRAYRTDCRRLNRAVNRQMFINAHAPGGSMHEASREAE